ncbi:MAG TPA: ATP-binding cassette domain-containing protein [Bacteroidales bacterium]|jgi:zinc transport system ATP-binding protein|nr:ATP-binding cassette domain-containing protein [Bacteroidales bacterium]HNY52147.1 ATP-binding cassette domain-containing protein [Bacteroidales bacterium]HOG55704.1 ATP-binding cassette domain-containing protein [Bacteroidales bacterium]HPB12285.1 ATP-binding cassette domain-containing protein [Bacteroidales bacterium]HPX42753.1 ATP-binding cassette domain-containing protein [Bacteroidales bacterium]
MPKPLLELISVSVSYGEFTALENVALKVMENDFIGIIGPNGGGKTTLLKAILGLVPIRGKIEFSPELQGGKKIGYLPQISTGDHSFPLTVTDVVLSGLMLHKGFVPVMTAADKARAATVIDELGLRQLADSPLSGLSGGQLQRVFLGRAVIGDPKLLLLDEPGSFVDSNFEHDFYEKLRILNKRMAILMVSHDIGTISSHVRSFACVNRNLHYHPSSEISNEQLQEYGCPIQLITHGEVPHTVLKKH